MVPVPNESTYSPCVDGCQPVLQPFYRQLTNSKNSAGPVLFYYCNNLSNRVSAVQVYHLEQSQLLSLGQFRQQFHQTLINYYDKNRMNKNISRKESTITKSCFLKFHNIQEEF